MTDDWAFRAGVNTEYVLDFLLCVADIADSVNELKDADKTAASL